MAGDYSWELPAWGDTDYGGTSWRDTGNEAFWGTGTQDSWEMSGANMGNSNMVSNDSWYDFGDESWYVDSTGGGKDSSVLSWMGDAAGDVWSWLKTPQGTNVAFGTIKGLLDMWKTDLASRMKGNPSGGGGGGGGSNAAELYDARVKMHNASINKPMDMGLVRFQK